MSSLARPTQNRCRHTVWQIDNSTPRKAELIQQPDVRFPMTFGGERHGMPLLDPPTSSPHVWYQVLPFQNIRESHTKLFTSESRQPLRESRASSETKGREIRPPDPSGLFTSRKRCQNIYFVCGRYRVTAVPAVVQHRPANQYATHVRPPRVHQPLTSASAGRQQEGGVQLQARLCSTFKSKIYEIHILLFLGLPTSPT